MDAMTKNEIVESISTKTSFSKKETAYLVDMVFDTLKATLESGQNIKLTGFGNFVVKSKKARVGRNPKTGEQIEITARKVVTFKPSSVLKNALSVTETP